MKFISYIEDKYLSILLYFLNIIFTFLVMMIFKIKFEVMFLILFFYLFIGILILLINYYKKCNFYNNLLNNVKRLDKKYLVLETLPTPNTYEEKIFVNILYDINKSMIEDIKNLEYNIIEFKDFVEMWIHEVKIPISSLVLKCHNNKNISNDFLEQVNRLDNYIDEVLYYVRSENTDKDFVITEVDLKKIIKNVSLKNKDDILNNNIDLIVENVSFLVNTDGKWMEFILNQIINNSIKYKSNKDSIIKISCTENENNIILSIYDNGIGIQKQDIKNVFNKTFTGTNGRKKVKSTGMGLYIAKNLCNKLGHDIKIDSVVDRFTRVDIIFGKNDFYKM